MSGLILADSPAPVMDAAWIIVIVSRVLHTATGAMLLGGLVFLKRVVAPAAADAENSVETPEQALYRGKRSSWAGLVMLATTLLLVSGFFNFCNYMAGYEKLPSTYHMLFGIKFLLAMFVFFVAAGTAGKSPMALKMQNDIGKWLNRAIGAALLIFILAAAMRTFEKVPKAPEEPANAQRLIDETPLNTYPLHRNHG